MKKTLKVVLVLVVLYFAIEGFRTKGDTFIHGAGTITGKVLDGTKNLVVNSFTASKERLVSAVQDKKEGAESLLGKEDGEDTESGEEPETPEETPRELLVRTMTERYGGKFSVLTLVTVESSKTGKFHVARMYSVKDKKAFNATVAEDGNVCDDYAGGEVSPVLGVEFVDDTMFTTLKFPSEGGIK